MRVAELTTRGFRNLADSTLAPGPELTVVHGPNGAGKTNLLEALYFALTGRSCRTRREREMVAFGGDLARAGVRLEGGRRSAGEEAMTMLASVSGETGRQRRADGRPLQPSDDRRRPAVSVFMPDRLALVKGPPARRRAHLDRLVAAIWPARAGAALAYRQALAQRNAMLTRLRRGADPSSLDAWDSALAERAVPLIEARAEAAAKLAAPFTTAAVALGLEGEARLEYRPRAQRADPAAVAAELAERRQRDLDRGFTGHGPHLDELAITLAGRPVRRYGSQGQQRLALLALLFAEREVLRLARRQPPLLLLDDVMSELDPERRASLISGLAGGGQALITTTEPDQVPAGGEPVRIGIVAGRAKVEEAA